MYEVVPILGDMSSNSCRGSVFYLDSESVGKVNFIIIVNVSSVFVSRQQIYGKVCEKRRFVPDLREAGGIEITPEVWSDMSASAVVAGSSETRIMKPTVLPNRIYVSAYEFASRRQGAVEITTNLLENLPDFQVDSIARKSLQVSYLLDGRNPRLP